MKYRKLAGKEELSAIGLGCMSMSHAYGVPDDEESIKTLHFALDLGINFGIRQMCMETVKMKN
jgi:aryl-alcohol dehydrogenase-like predicted oxidoreductase